MEGVNLKPLYLVLLTAHILGDYYLQTQEMSDRKVQEKRALFLHCLVYAIPFVWLAGIFQFDYQFIFAAGWAVVCHGVIDFAKAAGSKRVQARPKKYFGDTATVYLLDQSLHWVSLFLIAFFIRSGGDHLVPWPILVDMLDVFDYTWYIVLQWVLALLLIYRPSNITFVKLFAVYKPEEERPVALLDGSFGPSDREKLRAGGTIGLLEKFISLIFLSVGEYMAIGLILTAKSIARYDKIAKSSTFAEYYLIGTLTSIIMVMLIYYLCFVTLG
ncbi:MAG: DUF3307 domain-containing protein [Clostridiaceae bacterium]